MPTRARKLDFTPALRFLQRVERATALLGVRTDRAELPLYRGMSDARWPLLPTLHRRLEEGGPTTRRQARNIERDLFFEFEARAYDQVRTSATDDWDTLFLMRHHGVPTRLLDWTDSLLMAVYFAIGTARDPLPQTPSCVWVLNPFALNALKDGWNFRDLVAPRYLHRLRRRSTKFRYADWLAWRGDYPGAKWPRKRPIALYPLHSNPRLRAQRGYFTLHGDDARPLEAQVDLSVRRRFLIPDEARPALRALLRLAGIRHFGMLQSLDGLALDLIGEYFPASS